LSDIAIPFEIIAGVDRHKTHAGKPAKDIEVQYITNPEKAADLREEWDALEECFGNPLLSGEWFISAAQTFCPPDVLKVIAVRSNNQLSGIAPLSIKGKSMPRVELVGSSILQEPGGLLYRDHDSLMEAIRAVLDLRIPAFLMRLNFLSNDIEFLEGELRRRKLFSIIREERIPWVFTKGKWEDFEKQISSSRRSSLRRLQRMAETKGKVQFETVVPTPENLNGYLEEVFSVEAMSWKGRTGTAMKTNPMLGKFFRMYAEETAKRGQLHLFFLKVDERTVAVQFTVAHANRLWIYKVGHDESWSWCSPGVLLMHQVVRFCFERGLTGCEFLGSDEPWLHIWANESHCVVTYRIYSKSVKGIVDLLFDLGKTYTCGIAGAIQKKMAQRTKSQSDKGGEPQKE